MSFKKLVHLLGYASGSGGRVAGSGDSPKVLQKSTSMQALNEKGLEIKWEKIINSSKNLDESSSAGITDNLSLLKNQKVESIAKVCEQLAKEVSNLIKEKKSWMVIGGDHTCAIGTWSGVYDAVHHQGDIGLIWIDAHMDSHTPETSETGNIHGMPLACLLGRGESKLTQILSSTAKIKPQNLCLIGVRSFESGEAELLKSLNVRIFYMEEIKQKGMQTVMKEAVDHVTRNTIGFGVSVDIDSIDPIDAPGTGVKEPNGIPAQSLLNSLYVLNNHPKMLGAEIVEFNPHLDEDQKTEKLIPKIIAALIGVSTS